MGYCTYEEILKIFPERSVEQLADDSSSGYPVIEVVNEAIGAESVIIDIYVGKVAELPIAEPVPPILGTLNAQMAVHNLYSRGRGAPEHWQKKYDACIRILEQIARGDLSLQPIPEEPETPRAVMSSNTRTADFGAETMTGY